MIVRWSLSELPEVLAELGIERPFVVASPRWENLLDVPAAGRWTEVPSDRIEVAPGADALLAVGGGSAIDTAKHASTETGLPVVSVPTTYSGAEWTPMYGVRDPARRMVGGGSGARLEAIVYEVELTLGLPRAETVGTALNALAHCAEALYVAPTERSDELALAGAESIATALPRVVEEPGNREARERLLRGASAAGEALAIAGLGLAHAMAQALGGTYGISHGAMNALTLPPALRFNAAIVPEAVARFAGAIGADDAAAGVEALARLGGFGRLREFGVPEAELGDVAATAAGRAANQRNPQPATPAEIEALLRSIY